ncbi:alpha,alpha-trehalose-phosphate synthase (UDP-forming) [Corynebacterium striatum]|uniref:alpha,alpha-trehalose-phosphate synthase (UDP-forming) n=1 Tax=Corynebacterium striatum TaxID=43770 RepID=UPI000673CD1C|nr:trehalose-6-phosphate synthase [Corynebacterium striatum]NHX52624.1 trehalose-6-phosphate synthase [Corynebacterium striatum]NHY37227.1 trehalose-6-phosphate synthase [Corynebacterium striatum]CQD08169.1 Trehalose-phosphate synthase [Corynebacterium striatum]HAT1133464.1 trehalose-6-phosphate synthase [Corynebacterium striatum]HAT1156190.1 trehalose-6-phosphate synthase [Corynebacterium striatum]
MSGHDNSFVVVANRLPVDLEVQPDGTRTWKASPGGLVTALSPVLEAQQGCWVGWPGVINDAPEPFTTERGVLLHPVKLTEADFEGFYEGFSNATLWPLYHDLIVTPVYKREWWYAYREVNLRFAEEVAKVAAPNATVWVQDYQLQLLPGILRQLRPDLTIGFFLHIPFPSADLFLQLPWREEVVRGLMGADVIGFHLESNARNFLELAKRLDLEVTGKVSTREISAGINVDGRTVGVGAFPISIETSSLANFTPADEQEVARLRAEFGGHHRVILGVDRLDYTKGILQRLKAFEELLETEALDPREVALVQVATPSRERIDHYRATRSQVEEAVGRINGRFGQIGCPVVHYVHRAVPKDALRKYYRLADVMLVTPFKDGMNLVAKEYVAAHSDGRGALVLSEFAGAADELTQANLCNPFDIESIKRALLSALKALDDAPDTMRQRMLDLHEQVISHDVNVWSRAFLGALDEAAVNK